MSATPTIPKHELPVEGIPPLWRMTVAQYHDMITAGILDSDDPIELLEGVLVQKMSKSPAHRIGVRRVRMALERVVPQGWSVETQDPITLADSEPEPDVAVIRGQTEDYADRHPGAAEVALVVEVAGASLARDSIVKRRVYARAGIPFYWIVDLAGRRLVVLSEPAGGEYQQEQVLEAADSAGMVLAGKTAETAGELRVADLLS